MSGWLCAACHEEVGETSAEQLPEIWGWVVVLLLGILCGVLGIR